MNVRTTVGVLHFGWRTIRLVGAGVLAGLLAACTALLPHSSSEASRFESFEEARMALETLVPMQSNRSAVEKAGFAVQSQPNTKTLTHADIVRLFVPAGLIKREDLDSGILACLEARDACHGLEIQAYRIGKRRTGNFWTDFIGFRQRTETTGWRFNALILFVNDVVVYRVWGGQPRLDDVEVITRPLGPFQDIGPSLVPSIK